MSFTTTIIIITIIIPCNRVVLEKLTVPQLVKKFPVFNETRKFVTTITWTTTFIYPEPDKSTPRPILLSEDQFLEFFFPLSLGFPSGLFPASFPTKPLYATLHFQYDDDDDNDDKNNYLLKFSSLSLMCFFGSSMANYRSINNNNNNNNSITYDAKGILWKSHPT